MNTEEVTESQPDTPNFEDNKENTEGQLRKRKYSMSSSDSSDY